jgi:hypothetical protein
MTTGSRRIVLTGSLAALMLALVLAACGPTGRTSPSTAPSATAPTQTVAPSSSVPSSPAPAIGQTDTEWGRIWDAVPSGFPRFPGATPADDTGGEPVSARYAVPDGHPEAIAAWMQSAMETATFSTEGLNGPFEGSSFVLDSVGDGECRIQTTIAPLGGMTIVTVRYGAACPAA